jgi:S-methyl-5-thioribose-1-phosphate isomerase/adenine phosphoribosyltransferase
MTAPAAQASRSLDWRSGALIVIDQTRLPHELRELRLDSVDDVIDAVQRLAIRGAPAIGVAGAFAVALSAKRHARTGTLDMAAVQSDAARVVAARPTAVNLAWAVGRALEALPRGADAVLARAKEMLAEDERTNDATAARAADLVLELCGERALTIGTHCNTGRLATVATGTALGTIRNLAARGCVESVLASETRPLLQGARLTTWELAEAGIDHRLCVDSAMAAAAGRGMLDCVLVGADRVAANGDVANKIGTYGLAVAAARSGIPFIVVAPESTFDRSTHDGNDIEIEERPDDEVVQLGGVRTAPEGTRTFNPAFDVTPADLVTAIVSEQRVYRPAQAAADAAHADLAAAILAQAVIVPDFPKAGIEFFDLSAMYAQARLIQRLAEAIADQYRGRFDHVLALEARGLPLGTTVAQIAQAPLVVARKPGKLPGAVRSASYACEYRGDTLELQADALAPGDRVLVIDDVLATGRTLGAAAQLVGDSGAELSGFAVVLELDGLGGRSRLAPHPVFSAATVADP